MSSLQKFKILVSLLVVAVALVLVMPRSSKLSLDYTLMQEWQYETLVAKFDFPVLKTDDELKAEKAAAAASAPLYFDLQEEVLPRIESEISSSHKYLLCEQAALASVAEIYSKGVVADDALQDTAPRSSIVVVSAKTSGRVPAGDVWKLSEAREKFLSDVSSSLMDMLAKDWQIEEVIVPNLVYNPDETSRHLSETVISPTKGYVSVGEQIVASGDIVTPEVARVIDSYAREWESNTVGESSFLFWAGRAMAAAVLVALLFFSIYFTSRSSLSDRRFLYILLVFLIASVGTLLVLHDSQDTVFLLPLTLSALYLQAFFKDRLTLSVYTVSLLPALMFAADGAALMLIFLAAGFVSIWLFRYLGKGWKQFVLALIVFGVMAFVYYACCSVGLVHAFSPRALSRLFLASFLPIAGYPLIFLFERLFNLVSNSRLSELCDTSTPLLRTLEQKAPGTFQHSLQVMNMADVAARSIDCNPLLLRAGALYHDIGKIQNPRCFVENESLMQKEQDARYHSLLSPQRSAEDIIKHVSDGVELARRNHLPDIVASFIRSHHGTTLVSYFYSRYLSEGGDPAMEPEFHYPGVRPQSKEEVILMLCDSIEAASRTLDEFTPESCSALVEKIVAGKMAESQFDDADISLSELGIVKESIKSYLAQMHHERVAYPERQKQNK